MSNWRDNLRKIEPYVPGEQPDFPDMIKLNTNENPYPPSPKVREVMEHFDESKLRLYPDPASSRLVQAIADYNNVKNSQVFVGVGSDDVLAIAFMAFFNSKKPILFADITYSFYDVWAELFRIPYEKVPLNDKFEIVPSDYYRENGGVIIANPNAPTGIAQSINALEDIIQHNQDVVVIIDEAYVDFSSQTALNLIQKYDNVLIVQTYSKSRSLAGMRIGHAFGSEELISALNDVRYSFNSYPMTRLSVEIGAAVITDTDYFEQTKKKVIATREWVKRELIRLGFTFGDSMTNFIFATHDRVPAQVIFDKLREKHIFVRHFSAPRIDNYLRISIGTEEEMRRFLNEVAAIIEEYRG
ncbi:MAG: histidinol-phosphate transaminase [Lachnospiraceae bacterium]|jgi:histidinol-phosphate aminotransferase|nr:histidinol-phosphate transaminase [Lachnospiraceae bacterium]